ncbi:hypothetical protein SUGI_0212770 [Cryptomeria japonica]|uniref:histone deacetylase HDT1 isoform X2 n=1 Tax=Cryptomeria japonica TaxID=3369 RepID=UPI002408EB4A|nr:histone deacetylase HDT1 isoform X2 [Cryptomeria japonica]GLJ13459.1 hypothetical protein SUGI_0212770 [Cryptomeria japonica]
MECFWGVEVKPGQALTCESFKNDVINLTQVALGETTLRRDNERVLVYLHVDKKIIVLGTLIHGRCHQIGLNLIFNKSFQISHSSKYASLFFCGYSRVVPKWKQSARRDDDADDEGDDKDFEDFCSSDDGSEKDEDEDDYDDDDDDDKDEGIPMDSDTETPRIIQKGNVSTSEDDSKDEEGEYDEVEDMEDSRSDDKDEESEDEVDSSEDEEDEEISRVAMMCAGNHKRPRPNSGIKTPKTNKKAKVVTPHVEKPGKGKKCVQFSTHYDGASKGAKKGKRTTGGSEQQSLVSKKGPKSSSTPWPGKKGHYVAKQAKGS